jgi:pimeloyl-ACP methyl ester carboxylesterase
MVASVLPDTLPGRVVARLAGTMFAATIPAEPADAIVTIEAEDRFDLEARLGEIRAPTLVAAGTRDLYYPVDLVRRTAAGIPGARLVLYDGQRHPAHGRQFEQDVLAFLAEPGPAAPPALPGRPNPEEHHR